MEQSRVKPFAAMLLALCMLTALLAGCGAASAPGATGSAQDMEYLQQYYSTSFEGTTTAEQFAETLGQLTGQPLPATGGGTAYAEAAKAMVIAANFEELALSYGADKAAARLAGHSVKGVAQEYAPYVATALDTGLLTPGEASLAAKQNALSAEAAATLAMRVLAANGGARNVLGTSADADIYDKLNNAWNSFLLFDDAELTQLGKTAVEQGITTGYSLKYNAYSARFLPRLTMQYGHSDIKHAHQLLGLLNSENIVAQIQLEPKVSVYQYLLEWGPVPEPSPGYEVREFEDGLYLVFALEYDLLLEFKTEADMQRFDGVIERYAKKYEGNEEAIGLLYASWWQPLYNTVNEDMPQESYHLIYDCVVTTEWFSLHSFCLPDDVDAVAKSFENIGGGMPVSPLPRYCNTAFYNYLSGQDYQ